MEQLSETSYVIKDTLRLRLKRRADFRILNTCPQGLNQELNNV